MDKISTAQTLVFLSLFLGATSACSLKSKGAGDSHRVSITVPPSDSNLGNLLFGGNQQNRLASWAPANTINSVNQFACLGLNVMGPSIPWDGETYDYCIDWDEEEITYAGITAGLIPSWGGEIEVYVPAGPDRIFQVIGFRSTVGCPDIWSVLQDYWGDDVDNGYELGRTVADVTGETSVAIDLSWNQTEPKKVFCHNPNSVFAVGGVSPIGGPPAGGGTLTVYGSGFLVGATVDLDNISCTGVTVVDSNTITCTVPAHASAIVDVDVTNPDGDSDTIYSGYNYNAGPTISTVTPSAGLDSGGTAITITGGGFLEGAYVEIGGACCTVTSVTSTQINCVTSARAAGTVNVVVTNEDTQSDTLANGYTYTIPP